MHGWPRFRGSSMRRMGPSAGSRIGGAQMPESRRESEPTMDRRFPLGPAAASADAVRHFESSLAFETDCWDVHQALQRGTGGFVVLDVRPAADHAAGHVPGAVSLPHALISEPR